MSWRLIVWRSVAPLRWLRAHFVPRCGGIGRALASWCFKLLLLLADRLAAGLQRGVVCVNVRMHLQNRGGLLR